jgi:hypothetical protein
MENLKRFGTKMHPSDHFGLAASFTILRINVDEQADASNIPVSERANIEIQVHEFCEKVKAFDHFDYQSWQEIYLKDKDMNSTGFRPLKKTIMYRMGLGMSLVGGLVGAGILGIGHKFFFPKL